MSRPLFLFCLQRLYGGPQHFSDPAGCWEAKVEHAKWQTSLQQGPGQVGILRRALAHSKAREKGGQASIEPVVPSRSSPADEPIAQVGLASERRRAALQASPDHTSVVPADLPLLGVGEPPDLLRLHLGHMATCPSASDTSPGEVLP